MRPVQPLEPQNVMLLPSEVHVLPLFTADLVGIFEERRSRPLGRRSRPAVQENAAIRFAHEGLRNRPAHTAVEDVAEQQRVAPQTTSQPSGSVGVGHVGSGSMVLPAGREGPLLEHTVGLLACVCRVLRREDPEPRPLAPDRPRPSSARRRSARSRGRAASRMCRSRSATRRATPGGSRTSRERSRRHRE